MKKAVSLSQMTSGYKLRDSGGGGTQLCRPPSGERNSSDLQFTISYVLDHLYPSFYIILAGKD